VDTDNAEGPVIGADDLRAGLRRLGVREGETVLVHASLSRFGVVDGGAGAVADALLSAVGPAGTVLAPAFTFSNGRAERPFLDLLGSPSEMGAVPEELRHRAGPHRSAHLTHSVAAVGAGAAAFTAGHSVTPCGQASAFWKLIERSGSVVLLGVSLNSMTLFHAIEEHLRLPYIRFRDLAGECCGVDGVTRPLLSQCHNSLRRYDFNPQAAVLEQAGVLRAEVIGRAVCRRIAAQRLWEFLRPRLEGDPYLLTLAGEERVQIPVTVDGKLA